ncbi:hypothetical protein BBR47_22430 [Brevibacillus brevis NBRC 100599]|uniref:Uncharacterized protein n=2 Tax=Brevibacillus TaxID=55080 RepID=C0ZBR1_BREBN|nr:hypothetical protein BBR47_22430 [Brevibacillus brevis NBRC 100599]
MAQESEGIFMEDMKKLKRMLLVTSSLGFAVFAMVVVTEIVRISL